MACRFNVTLGLRKVVVMNSSVTLPFNQPCSDAYLINNRLSDFAYFRGKNATSDDAGLCHLMSTCNSGSIIGLAYTGGICTRGTYPLSPTSPLYVSGVAISTVFDQEWLVVAHETGHNFGAYGASLARKRCARLTMAAAQACACAGRRWRCARFGSRLLGFYL